MDAFSGWWGSLDGALRIFYTIGLASGLVLVLQMAMMFFGFDGGGDADADADVDGDVGGDLHDGGGGSVFSVRTINAFLVGFGWTGVAMLRSGSSVPVATLVAFLVGLAFMMAVFALMRLVYSLRASGTIDYRNAVGEIGQVYVTVGPGMEKTGQVEVMVQGRLCTVAAMTRAQRVLSGRTRVRVVDVVDRGTLLVEPLDSGEAS